MKKSRLAYSVKEFLLMSCLYRRTHTFYRYLTYSVPRGMRILMYVSLCDSYGSRPVLNLAPIINFDENDDDSADCHVYKLTLR